MTIKLGNTEINAISVIEPYGDDLRTIADEPLEPWVRPSHWPDMPVINSGEHKCNFLAKVPSGINGSESVENYFALNAYSKGAYPHKYTDFTIDWGDGNSVHVHARTGIYSSNPDEFQRHEYNFEDLDPSTEYVENGMTYRIALIQFDGNLSGIQSFNWRHSKNYTGGYRSFQNINFLEIDINLPSGTSIGVNYQGSYLSFRDLEKARVYAPKVQYLDSYFQNTPKLRSVEFGPFENLLSIEGLFSNCGLDYYPDLDTSNVTTASNAFNGMKTKVYNNNYDWSSATGISYLFSSSLYLKEVNIDIGSNATNIAGIFSTCRNLQKVTGNWDTQNVTDFYHAFYYNKDLTYVPDINYSSATRTQSMFDGCNFLRITPEINAPNLSNAQRMFASCSQLKKVKITDMSRSDASDFSSCFTSCSDLRTVEISNPRIAPTGNYGLNNFFSSCINLQTVPYIDMSGCRRATSMFYNCYSLKKVPKFNTSTLSHLSSMFNNCYSLTSVPDLDITCEGTGNVSIDSMFFSAGLKVLPNLDWSRVVYAYRAFACNASGQVSLDWSNLNYSTSTNSNATRDMFAGLKGLDIKELTLSESGNFYYNTFINCSLVSVPYVNASGGYNYTGLFSNTNYLQKGALSGVDKSIGYYRTALSSGGILDVFNGLASGVVGQSVDLRQAPSAYILHPDTISIATSKGWTVTT